MAIQFAVFIEIMLVVVGILACFWKPTLEVYGDDAVLPIGIVVNSWLARGREKHGPDYPLRVGTAIKWTVVATFFLSAIVWPVFVATWMRGV